MSFTASTFIPLSSMANSNAARIFSYRSADNTATVAASGYFDPAASLSGGLGLKDADVILCQQSDGTDFYEVAVSGVGVVTVALTSAFA
jgi:hypothetical protein